MRRRLANWSTLTRWRGLEGSFSSPAVKSAIRLAVRSINRPRARKSANVITADILGKLLATCSEGDLTDIRDQAILMVAFASGGRRRSEIASLRTEQLVKQTPVTAKDGSPLPSLAIHLGRTKTCGTDHDETVYLTGRPVEALTHWLEAAKIDKGACFEKSIAGAMFRRVRWNRAPSTGSSNNARKWQGLSRRSFQPTACVPAISPKPPIVAFHSRKPWNNCAIVPCNRRPIITTMPNGAVGGYLGCCNTSLEYG